MTSRLAITCIACTAWLALAGAASCLGSGCSGGRSTPVDDQLLVDGGTDARKDARDATGDRREPDEASDCCPISPGPGCCMEYGGSRKAGASCATVCDGMPRPGPAWRIGHDEYGCPYWIEPANTEGCCGCISPDAASR